MSIGIIRLAPSDAPLYRALMLQAFAKHPEAFTSSTEERSAQPLSWWESRLDCADDAKDIVLGAQIDGSLVGVAGISFETRDKIMHKATIFGMYVDEAARRTGAAAQLLAALLTLARNRHHTLVVQLTVTEGNDPAQRLYESAGFVPFGTEPFAVRVGDSFVSKLHMWQKLS